MNSLTQAPAPQPRLVFEAVLAGLEDDLGSVPSQHAKVFKAAFDFWCARDDLATAEARLLALDGRTLPPDARRRRKRRAGADNAADPAGSRPFGALPKRLNTVVAEVLARLLEGEKLTGMGAVFDCSTTRLADHVYRLHHKYGWCIEDRDVDVSTKDGRATQVTEYWVPRESIDAAMSAGGAEFCIAVRAARAVRRANAHMPGHGAQPGAAR